MKEIDKSRPVLVTGANGFVAGWLVKKLLSEGFTVHAAVRNPNDTAKTMHLVKAASESKGRLIFFQADLMAPGAYRQAMEGCELVYHTASPFILTVKNPQKELVDPAVYGTRNVLETANGVSSVKRVVLTSSVVAMCTDAADTVNAPNGFLTEENWNATASLDYQPYCYSKTLAEKKAWEIAGQQNRWDLVCINPSMVLGPDLNPHFNTSESLNMLKMLAGGQMKFGAPRIGIGVVDVRDLAQAHFKAGFSPYAHGRYITSGHNSTILELGQVLSEIYKDSFPLPKRALPKWFLMLTGPLSGNPLFTRRVIQNNVNIPWKADNSKAKSELGIQFRPLKQTLHDAFESLIDEKIITPKI